VISVNRHLVRVAQQRAHQALAARLKSDDVLTRGQHETTERHLASSGNCFPDRDERIGPDLAFRGQ
jgi:hypothetical protein